MNASAQDLPRRQGGREQSPEENDLDDETASSGTGMRPIGTAYGERESLFDAVREIKERLRRRKSET